MIMIYDTMLEGGKDDKESLLNEMEWGYISQGTARV